MFQVLIQQRFFIDRSLQVSPLLGSCFGRIHSTFDFRLQLHIVNIFQVNRKPFPLIRCENTKVALPLMPTPELALWCFGISSQQQVLPVNVVLYCVSPCRFVIAQMAVIK